MSQCVSDILLIPVSENKTAVIAEFYFRFDLDLLSSAAYHKAAAYQISSQSDHSRGRVTLIFLHAGHGS